MNNLKITIVLNEIVDIINNYDLTIGEALIIMYTLIETINKKSKNGEEWWKQQTNIW